MKHFFTQFYFFRILGSGSVKTCGQIRFKKVKFICNPRITKNNNFQKIFKLFFLNRCYGSGAIQTRTGYDTSLTALNDKMFLLFQAKRNTHTNCYIFFFGLNDKPVFPTTKKQNQRIMRKTFVKIKVVLKSRIRIWSKRGPDPQHCFKLLKLWSKNGGLVRVGGTQPIEQPQNLEAPPLPHHSSTRAETLEDRGGQVRVHKHIQPPTNVNSTVTCIGIYMQIYNMMAYNY